MYKKTKLIFCIFLGFSSDMTKLWVGTNIALTVLLNLLLSQGINPPWRSCNCKLHGLVTNFLCYSFPLLTINATFVGTVFQCLPLGFSPIERHNINVVVKMMQVKSQLLLSFSGNWGEVFKFLEFLKMRIIIPVSRMQKIK